MRKESKTALRTVHIFLVARRSKNILAISDHQAELAEFTIEVLSLVESVTEDVHPLLFPDRLTVSNATALNM